MINRLKLFIVAILCITKLQGQVSLQTGSATFSLPMFNWQDDKSRLNSVVALSYNSGNGLRVSDVASNAGQGWNLIAGGEIVRMQAGEPDDQVVRNGNGTDYDISKYPSGILFATVPASNGCPNALTKYPIYGWKNQLYAQHNTIGEDKQLDYFSFQFNGKAGMFVLDPTSISGNSGVGKSLGDTKMKITFQLDGNLISQGIRTKITAFTIEDIDGLIYKFSLHGLTKALKTSYCDENFNYIQTQPKKFQNGKVYYQASFDDAQVVKNPWIVGSWHLTEIEDVLTHRKVQFTYEVRDVNASAGDDISINFSNRNYSIITHKTSITKTPELSSVVYPDGHTVTVNYGKARFDMNGESAIASVDVGYQGRYLSKYELNTSYFILNRFGTPVTDYQKKVARLCLLSVRKIGVDLKEDTPPYIFDYYTGSNTGDDFVPPPFFYAKDIWGFYNGDNSGGYNNEVIPLNTSINHIKNFNQLWGLCFRRSGSTAVTLNAKAGYAKNGLLRQIVYPTGGTLTYEYAQNTGIIVSSNINVGGVHVAKTSSTDGGYSNDCSNPIVTNYNYVLGTSGNPSSLWGLEMPVNSIVSYNHYQPEWKSWHMTASSFPFGECYWHYQYPGIISRQQAINLTEFQRAMVAISPVLGILSIMGTINDVVAAFDGTLAGLILDVIVGITNLAITCIGDQSKNSMATVYFNSDMNNAAPLPAQFKRVEVVEGSGTIGKTIQEFTSSDDYAVWEPTNPVFSAKQRFASWAYGLSKKTTVLNANGDKIKETENAYDFIYAKRILNYCQGAGGHGMPCNSSGLTTNLVSCKCEVVESSSQRSVEWTDPATHNTVYHTTTNANIMKVDFYGMYTGRTLLTSTTEKIYKANDPTQFAATVTSYIYNDGTSTNGNYEPNTISVQQSNGDVNFKFINYSNSYSGGALTTLVNSNIIALPVQTSTAVYKAGSPYLYLGENVTEFVQLANGDIKPSRILEQRFSQPTLGSSITFYQGPGGSTSQYKAIQTFTYDAAQNLTGIKDEGGRTISNIYDYDDKYVVASVINSDPIVDKPAYTSFETGGIGNWVLTGTPVYSGSSAITGIRSFTLSSGKSLSSPSLNTSRPYIVSFWATTTGITVTGGSTLSKSGPTINGFTYYEYEIAQGTSSVTVAGSGTLDELRIYPKTAKMRTLTYDPIIGKTSECDENNRITYYEYDNLGRLRFIKDEKGNIVKMHEYNNVSAARQNGCPGVYYNHLIKENFIKNNCSAGYEGDTVIYTLAATTYSSSISQADADAQAEHYLLSNGQVYANTNGGCHLIYYNAAISITDTTQSCPPGYMGGPVTYPVPAGRYSSIISQADADEKAQDDLDANGWAYINDPIHANCTSTKNPHWVWLENGATYCDYVNGVLHRFIRETDMNPNSYTYLHTIWFDAGPDDTCSVPACNSSNCSGNDKKCINNFCETGVKIYTTSYYDSQSNQWSCTFHYEWSDGSWSQDYIEYQSSPCSISL